VDRDDRRASWTNQVEEALRSLRDVEDARVVADGDAVREIHVLTASQRSPKQIVRDVETTLLARFHCAIDHRVVSVAYTRGAGAPSDAGAPRASNGPVPDLASAAAPSAPGRAASERIRFVGANLFVAGPRVQAQVELRWKGLTRMGSASGTGTRQGASRLVAQATLEALGHFVEDEVALGVDGVDVVTVGGRGVAVVSLVLLADRRERLLTGTCPVEGDAPQAVALATLGALNRVIGGLRTKQPVEYVLRPTSA
jgi:hypothetical protein